MLVLVVAFLGAMYVGKILFPQDFVMLIENERLVAIGRFIDNHPLIYYICCIATSFITYWLYCCAVSHRKFLNWKECLLIAICLVVNRLISFVDESIATHISIALFFILPTITKGNLKDCAIVYSVHGLSQALALSIREFPMYFTNDLTFVSGLLMTLDCYLWLVLFYMLNNYEKEK